ncbi:uncharacterized protein LOC110689788 [Chenopodium quinoa]|uniref:uncharacterized protein LOC110689788 n=1 Tax=Chenopodium quinoa TaxID=63459 RepID=UPI000B792C3E|nr:uncharacterized protein LOC110689788 [Chenopodium quinoa]XP_021722296.1 uncharacterized protein LOC110689788 [Chenopodium quinoa]
MAKNRENPLGKAIRSEHFLDDSSSVGGQVKGMGEVIKKQGEVFGRPPNMNFRIETFSRICLTFDDRRTRWDNEMGLGGLLTVPTDIHLPRQLGYWLMTRIDPLNKVFIAPDGKQFRLSANQVHWVLGIPNGGLTVPTGKSKFSLMHEKVIRIQEKYGVPTRTRSKKDSGVVYTSIGIPVNGKMMERVEGKWEAHEEEEFKTLFLFLSLEMVLCPTQSPRLACDLLHALTCAMNDGSYNWCELVLKKLMESVGSFARRFYSTGVAGGCGGCTIFAVVFYLDRLNWFPVQWGEFPRIKVWDMNKLSIAFKQDRIASGGDYGKLGSLDVAYGEIHPKEARDSDGPSSMTKGVAHQFVGQPLENGHNPNKRRGAPKCSFPHQVKMP